MKRYLIVLMLVVIAVSVWGAEPPEYATQFTMEHWENWPRHTKVDFTHGFASGFFSVLAKLNYDFDGMEEYVAGLNDRISELEIGTVVDSIDFLYSTGEYDKVPVAVMIINAKMLMLELIEEEENGNTNQNQKNYSHNQYNG